MLASSFQKKIQTWPEVKYGDGKALQELADFLSQCETAMSSLGQLAVLNDPIEQQKILAKLPKPVQEKWFHIVDRWLYGSDESYGGLWIATHESYLPSPSFVNSFESKHK